MKRNNKNPFKGRQFTAEVILWAVRWYLQFPINYRDLECMLAVRGVRVDHTTLFRWIQAYAPELNKRIRSHLRMTNGSWRVDETYIRVKMLWGVRRERWHPWRRSRTDGAPHGKARRSQPIPRPL